MTVSKLRNATDRDMYLQKAISSSGVDPKAVEDISVGVVLAPGSLYSARQAALTAGFPDTVPIQVVNRFCSSGLMAITDIANKIRAGQIQVGLAIGVESMSQECVPIFQNLMGSMQRYIETMMMMILIYLLDRTPVLHLQVKRSRRIRLPEMQPCPWAGLLRT